MIPLPFAPEEKVLVILCCAPCGCAASESLSAAQAQTTLYFDNPNIMPREEYAKRLDAAQKLAVHYGLHLIEGGYDPDKWFEAVKGLEAEPERGKRCEVCFRFRLERAAAYAEKHGFDVLCSVLAFSRWKSAELHASVLQSLQETHPRLKIHDIPWRKGGSQPRNNEILRELNLYIQDYCGCPFSVRQTE